jgi:tRNA pseudouridine38-40 synthase
MTEAAPEAAASSAAADVYRIALGVEYKGSRYRGFQRQRDGVPSIQLSLENALSKVAGGHSVTLSCAGRTDALVHACAQVVHFDTPVSRSMHAWVMGANMNLPSDISVTWAKEMPNSFDARFSAMARRYRYVIYNDQIRPAHLAEEVTWNHRPLDVALMRDAARAFVGTHDFSAFRARQCQAKSPIKTIHHLELLEHGRLIVIDVRANAFLHHMVRNIVGALLEVGKGRKSVNWLGELLDMRDRTQGGVTAPACGLVFIGPRYSENWNLPEEVTTREITFSYPNAV